ncbi:hypothetical protein DVDV_4225 [Desulfovibrio sp. DV]|nr:hypothetical protein DVDV_4225 [Desulfovibrio sp. DV]
MAVSAARDKGRVRGRAVVHRARPCRLRRKAAERGMAVRRARQIAFEGRGTLPPKEGRVPGAYPPGTRHKRGGMMRGLCGRNVWG